MRPRTASARDAMLRTAAEAAVDAAMEQSGAQLGGMPPAALITGLAGDLGEFFKSCFLMFRAGIRQTLYFLMSRDTASGPLLGHREISCR